MNSIADSLVYAVTYINCRQDEAEGHLDDDVGAIESIAAFLGNATDAEKDALAAAARRALRLEEAAASPRHDFIQSYANWMECMFGEEWAGNDRV